MVKDCVSCYIRTCFHADDVQDEMCSVYIEMPANTQLESSQCIGQVAVTMETTWSELEERLSSAVMSHISAVTTGMRTKRTSWLEQDLPPPSPYSLGLTLDSVRSFCIGEKDRTSQGQECDYLTSHTGVFTHKMALMVVVDHRNSCL